MSYIYIYINKKKKKILSALAAAALAVSAVPFSGISVNAADEDVSGNSMLDADELSMGKVVSGEIGSNNDNDWYTFTLAEPSKINFSLAITGYIMYTDMVLIDGDRDNAEIFKKENGLSGFNKTLYLAPGTYYLGVIHHSSTDVGMAYDFKLTADPCNLSFEGNAENNTMTEAVSVDFDTEYNAQISQNDDIDYYTFELPNDARVTFNFSGTLNAVDWNLYDNQDDLIKHGIYQKNNESDSKITKRNSLVLKSGRYTVSLSKNSSELSYGPYTFSFDYREDYNDLAANGIIAFGDVNKDGSIDASDASLILSYYAYLSTGGTETDMDKWIELL